MRVLIIDPPYERILGMRRSFFPLGALSVASHAQRAGHEVAVLDGEVSPDVKDSGYRYAKANFDHYLNALNQVNHPIWQEMSVRIRSFKPEVVGLSVMTVKIGSATHIARIVKQIGDIPVVMGGIHPTALPAKVLADANIDYVVVGEGEERFVRLLTAIEEKRSPAALRGIAYRENGAPQFMPGEPPSHYLDRYRLNRELLLDFRNYTSEDLGLMMGSRGCPFNCTYCASKTMWGGIFRHRGLDDILDEIRKLRRSYRVEQITFEDDSFTLNRKFIEEFCDQLIDKRLKISWSAITRINLLDDSLVLKMKRSGCNHVRVGVETGSERILQITRKGLTCEQIRRGARLLNKHKIYWSAYFMIGIPEETEEDILKTLQFIEELRPNYCTLSIFTPYPGTVLYDQLLREGKLSPDADLSLFSHSSPYNYFMKNIAYERFQELSQRAAETVDLYNGSFLRLFKRAHSKLHIYRRKPSELLKDVKRYIDWRSQN